MCATKRQKATASDVALLAGVSKWTVSRAFTPGASIQPNTREAVMKAAKTLGYRPNLLARSLTQKRTHIIGVAVDELRNPNMVLLLNEVTRQLQSRGYMALVINVSEQQNNRMAMSLAYQLQVDGILFMATVLTPELIAIATEIHRVPLVQIGRNTDHPDIQVVNIDGAEAGREIGELLLTQGHRSFGYLKGPDTASHHLRRKEGYEMALEQAGYALNCELIAGEYLRHRGYEALCAYLDETPVAQRVTALFCENDILAIGALQALRERGVTMSIVGFDNIEEASAPEWQLTTYDQRRERLVEEGLNRLIDGVIGDPESWRRGELVVRQSHRRG
ncbi:LacI family DNA-binding transcriptional regulator [Klebsiella aerogenes]|uniref:LacI family DNA-binding transcriptional regulator n=1 Tax=Klebsiella aerogenes TaxID=548 RepID=UPI00063C8A09|nr:LacI family DNA-binding transcriptional regulator [Klebsiella aerogenes]EKZ5665049.1 LacI family DNA-binding transcriptional regulator [Klebsiella aerogenes]EMB4649451.1 LacI family DNA-binding transcriptional regulator [Klebsiella aerogenes]KLE96282.1 LacI family transcriptional regulator [Klebsiella aerogenes]HBV4838291.1 LacI family DNA-binding transcriptional regulator [Klebsiella aerogenes]HCD5425180.1 LacI family DNA-binding transcriptional regulator [Klebsiella aerogenes]